MPGGNKNLWYSYNVGNVHVLVFSTEHNFLPGSPQFTFIEADLAAVDRSVTPWVIVAGHRYVGRLSCGGVCVCMCTRWHLHRPLVCLFYRPSFA